MLFVHGLTIFRLGTTTDIERSATRTVDGTDLRRGFFVVGIRQQPPSKGSRWRDESSPNKRFVSRRERSRTTADASHHHWAGPTFGNVHTGGPSFKDQMTEYPGERTPRHSISRATSSSSSRGSGNTSGNSDAATARTGPSFSDQMGDGIPMVPAELIYDTSSDQPLTTPPRQCNESARPRGLPEHLARGVRSVTHHTREARDPTGHDPQNLPPRSIYDDFEQFFRQMRLSDNDPDDTPSHISRTERAAHSHRRESVSPVHFSRQSESTDRLEPTVREVMARILLITIDGLESPSKTVIKKIAVNRVIDLHPRQFEDGCNEVVLRDRLQKHWDQVAVHECKPVCDDTLAMLIELGYVVTSTKQSPGGDRRYANSWAVHYLSGKGLRALVDKSSTILPSAGPTNGRASG
jgi:hypothetical protein